MADLKVDFHGLLRQYHEVKPAVDAAVQEVLESGVYVLGPRLKEFEQELAANCRMKEAVGVNSGTDALWLTLKGLGIGPGDEVIVPANSYFATAEAVWIAGATAVFVDIDPQTRNIDPGRIESAITANTRAIIPVHLYGHPAEMRAIAAIARRHNLRIIEDTAQALGAKGGNFLLGELSDAMCVSFTPQKNLGCYGDGGAILTNHPALAEELRLLRNHGSVHSGSYNLGYNSRLDEIQAAILSVKLKLLENWIDNRRRLAREYERGLSGTALQMPFTLPGFQPSFQFFVIETENRDNLQEYLASRGITTHAHYARAIHQQEGYPWGQPARIPGSLEHTERAAARVLSLPLYPELSEPEIQYVLEAILAWDQAQG